MQNVPDFYSAVSDPINHTVAVFPRDVIPQPGALDLPPHFREFGNQGAGAVQLCLHRISSTGISGPDVVILRLQADKGAT
jgi:hypothetical protein